MPRGPAPAGQGGSCWPGGAGPLPAASLSCGTSALPCWGKSLCHPAVGPAVPSPPPAGPGSYNGVTKIHTCTQKGAPHILRLPLELGQRLGPGCFPHPCRDLSSSSPTSPRPLASIRAQLRGLHMLSVFPADHLQPGLLGQVPGHTLRLGGEGAEALGLQSGGHSLTMGQQQQR